MRQLAYCLLSIIGLITAAYSSAQGAIAGLDTNGIVYQIDAKTAALTPRTEESFTSFSLGGTARRVGKVYYVAVPSGASEKALYTATLKTSALVHVDLDRDDDVRALFFQGRKLFGVFYNGNAGTAGVYRVNVTTGVTTLVLDLSALNVEPIGGALSQMGGFVYMLVKPEIDSTQRQLLRFKPRANSAKLVDVVDGSDVPVLCEKFKPNPTQSGFVCLASALSETQVNVCRLSLRGKASCLRALPDVLRVGGGHTMLTQGRNLYHAFVYAPGEADNQRMVTFNARGRVKSNTVLSTILIGAHFQSETPAK